MQTSKVHTCKRCSGKGRVIVRDKRVTCPDCRGTGKSSDYQTK